MAFRIFSHARRTDCDACVYGVDGEENCPDDFQCDRVVYESLFGGMAHPAARFFGYMYHRANHLDAYGAFFGRHVFCTKRNISGNIVWKDEACGIFGVYLE